MRGNRKVGIQDLKMGAALLGLLFVGGNPEKYKWLHFIMGVIFLVYIHGLLFFTGWYDDKEGAGDE